jgi:VanZ family protein
VVRRHTRLYRLYQIAAWHQFVLLTGYATYLSLVPQPGAVFESVWDKLLHVICWFVLTLSLRVAWPTARFPVWAALGLFLYSVLVETVQHFVPERDFNPYDLVGNGVGIVAAYGLVLLLWPPVEKHVIRRLQ